MSSNLALKDGPAVTSGKWIDDTFHDFALVLTIRRKVEKCFDNLVIFDIVHFVATHFRGRHVGSHVRVKSLVVKIACPCDVVLL